MKHFFTIIGGMGTEATETYIHQLNERTPANSDQEYLNYILVNHSTVPDRTAYIKDHSKPNPLTPLVADIKAQSQLGPDFFFTITRHIISMMKCKQLRIFHPAHATRSSKRN